ncbi:competence/damage-inducible protein A [Crassaminicella thermophila]|uniref:Putative competence-damage inducible protein n=1 Tax=Crassaminicella thermophila TaxID=2599308 RepID=A0A5C0SCF7_CRATE|nr:competence/damage-inducible protein A [Crassaminicella thermophila]QEK12215.1 competence/damage-inducible protein A [Crassaminicella thermophila]
MNCSIISVGTEILFGQIINTNAVYLSQQLNELGLNVYYHYTVGDNSDRLKETLAYAMSKSDLIITTGGLGPTQDDLTKEIIAKVVGKKLELHKPSYEKICKYFKNIKRPMNKNNLKQAYIPKDSIVLPNDCGTAPGFIIENDGKIIITLPGPPKEMRAMFDSYVKDYLRTKSECIIYSKVLRFFGIGESALETALTDLISNQTNPTIATYAKEGEVSVRITMKAENIDEANRGVELIIKEIKNRLSQYIYSYDDEELVEVVAKKLLEKECSISFAESCTGGLISSKLTSISGISKCLDRSIVTYSNEAKVQELGVSLNTLEKYGAVSEETAKEMALGLKEKTKSDLCLAVTGIAGPTGGTKEKPVGLVYIAIAYEGNVICNKYNIWGDRNKIRNYTTMLALNMIRLILK